MTTYYRRRGYGYFGIKGSNCYMPFLNESSAPVMTKSGINSQPSWPNQRIPPRSRLALLLPSLHVR